MRIQVHNPRLKQLIELDRKYGFISKIVEMPRYDNEPFFSFFAAKLNTSFKNGVVDWANSMQPDRENALLLSYYEAVERFFIAKPISSELEYGSYVDVKGNKIRLDNVANKNILNKTKDINKELLYWTKTNDLISGLDVYVPAQMVYLPFERDKDFRVRESISTGAACGDSYCDSVVKGVMECIERDYLVTTFLCKIEPCRITDIKLELLEYIGFFNLSVHLYKLNTNNEFHVVLCVLEDLSERNPPSISVGCACDFDALNSVEKATFEALKTRIWIKSEIKRDFSKFEKMNAAGKITSMLDRGFYWSHPKNKRKINFILKSRRKVAFNSLTSQKSFPAEKKLSLLKTYLQARGHSLLVKEFVNTDLSDKAVSVSRVIIPGLKPLYLDEKFKPTPDCDESFEEPLPFL